MEPIKLPLDYKLPCSNLYYSNTNTLCCLHDAGFFSILTVALWSLIDLYNMGIFPVSIDFSKTFSGFKNIEQTQTEIDIYPHFFKQKINLDKHSDLHYKFRLYKQNHHGIYANYNFSQYDQIFEQYFQLSDQCNKIKTFILNKYNINPLKTIAVIYRGTDKSTELKLASPILYLNKAELLLKSNPDYKVLIQTDQTQVQDLFAERFGNQLIFFDELPTSTGNIALHLYDSEELNIDKFQFGLRLLAITHLISSCSLIVNHTGNMGYWICLFRKSSKGVFQFDAQGHLIDIRKVIYGFLYEYIRKLKAELNHFVKIR